MTQRLQGEFMQAVAGGRNHGNVLKLGDASKILLISVSVCTLESGTLFPKAEPLENFKK